MADRPGCRMCRWGTCEREGRKTGEGQPCKESGYKIAALQKKRGWAHPPLSFPMKGRRRKEVCPPIVTEQSAEKSEE